MIENYITEGVRSSSTEIQDRYLKNIFLVYFQALLWILF